MAGAADETVGGAASRTAWWWRCAARSHEEQVMEAALLSGVPSSKRRPDLAVDTARDLLKLSNPPKAVTRGLIESFLQRAAKREVAAALDAGANPTGLTERRQIAESGTVPWLDETIAALLAKGALVNEHAGVANLQPLYKATPAAFGAVQSIIAERYGDGGAADAANPERVARTAAAASAAASKRRRKKTGKTQVRKVERKAQRMQRHERNAARVKAKVKAHKRVHSSGKRRAGGKKTA